LPRLATGWRRWAILGAATCVVTAALLTNLVVASVACGFDTETCAHGPVERWQGRFFDAAGRPIRGRLSITFPSQPDDADPVMVATDRAGRFCVRWPSENAVAVGEVHPGAVAAPTRDARVERELARFGYSSVKPAVVAVVDVRGPVRFTSYHPDTPSTREVGTSTDWLPADGRPDCVTPAVEPAWYDVEGVEQNWRVRVVTWISVAAFVAVVLASIAGRSRFGARLFWVATVTSAGSALACALVWLPTA
jgi:hypothetical protein